LRAERRRRIPQSGFSWIDRRFVREGHLARLSGEAALLYLFLVTVADRDGLSFWSERRIAELLRLEVSTLKAVRAELEQADLIAYRYPLYQVLSLPLRQDPAR
jgi:hypothetical protein